MGPIRLAAAALAAATVAFALVGAAGRARADVGPSPPLVAGLQLWFEAGTAVQADNAPVTLWPDKSGLGRDLSVGAGTTAPLMRRGAVNGRAAVEFNGVSDLLKTYAKSFTIAQPDTFFIVYKSLDSDTNPNRTFVFDSRNSSARQTFGRPSAGATDIYANLDLAATGTTYPFPSFQIWGGDYNGAASSLRMNETTVASGNAGTSGLGGFTLGGLSTSGNYGYDFGHELVAEVLVYQGHLLDVQRRAVTDWLDQKYDLLPADPPANAGLPAVRGTPNDTTALTADVGGWTGKSTMTFAYQWQLCSSPGVCADVAGATGATYAPTLADTGSTARVVITATNALGSATATSPESAKIVGTPPSLITAPTIAGTGTQGQTLTADPGTWAGDPPIAFTFKWRRCNSTGAACVQVGTASTYTLGAIDVYSVMQLSVTATNNTKAVAAPNVNTTQVQPAAPPDTALPVTTNLELWYDASQETYANGEKVMKLTDRSGLRRDLTTTDPNQAPLFKRDVVTGQPVVEFDGLSDLLKTYGSTFSLAQPDTFFIVYKALSPDTTAARTFVFDSTDSNVRQVFGRPAAGMSRMYANIDMDFGGVTYPFAKFELWSGVFDGTSSSMLRQGGLVGNGNAGGSNLSGFALGGLSTNGTLGYDLGKFQVAAIIYYSARLSAAEQQSVISWLDARYKVLQAPLPTGGAATIAGDPTQGVTLGASTGNWGGKLPIGFAYQWRRCDAAGASCSNIAGATSSSYTLATADVAKTIRVVVTASNTAGSASTTSAQTAQIVGATPVSQVLPAIAGTPTQGQRLATSTGTWGGTAPMTFAYQWRRCDSNAANCVAVATTPTYVLGAVDVGARIQVVVTATNSLGSGTATSDATAKVASTAPADAQPPVLAGLALWFDAASESYADGEPVTTLTDWSGLLRNLASDPADPRSAPSFRRNAVNGRPAVEFDGTTDLLKTYGRTFTIAQPDTFFVVYKNLDTNALRESWLFDSTNSLTRQLFGRAANGSVELYANLALTVPGIAVPFSAYELWSGTYNGGASSLWRKLAGQPSQVFAGSVGGSSLDGFSMGAASTTGVNGYGFAHALVAEVLWYAGPLSDADRTAIVNYLAAKYALN
ncbi:MAG: large repetitive protein [Gaiellaceae bacterium]|nr:large repetitive protein [Gaiellaceae bacterium]